MFTQKFIIKHIYFYVITNLIINVSIIHSMNNGLTVIQDMNTLTSIDSFKHYLAKIKDHATAGTIKATTNLVHDENDSFRYFANYALEHAARAGHLELTKKLIKKEKADNIVNAFNASVEGDD